MVRISGETLLQRPPDVVFDLVADERNLYDPRIRRAELLTQGPIGVGTRFRSVGGSEQRPIEMTVEITEHHRPHRLASTTRTASIEIHSTLLFEPEPPGTRMRWSSTITPRGWFRLLTPLLPLIGRRQMRSVWTALATELGSDVSPTPPGSRASRT